MGWRVGVGGLQCRQGAAEGGQTTFDHTNNSLIPGVTHVRIQKTPTPPHPPPCPLSLLPSPLLFALGLRASRPSPGACVFSSYLLSFKCLCLEIRAGVFFLRRPELQLRPPGLLRRCVDSADTIYIIISNKKEDVYEYL